MRPIPGFYEPIRKATNRFVGLSATEQSPVTSVFAGAASGVVGGRLFNTLHHMPRLISFLSLSCSWKPLVLDQSTDAGARSLSATCFHLTIRRMTL